MTWWCSATGQSWTWAWKAYPGVWLFVALVALACVRLVRRSAKRPVSLSAWFLTGLLSLWVALDWPIGALGAGYLASAHTASYILLSLVAPPCLILGMPRETLVDLAGRPGRGAWLRLLARPLPALTAYTVVLFTTHVPDVVDGLMSSQLGALTIDLAWLLGGFLLWWPVMAPNPEVSRLRRPLKMGYLFLATLPTIIPSAFLTFADYPLYATYELAPRVFPIMTAVQDQQVAGLTMKIIGDLPLWFAFGVIFFRWAREESAASQPVHPSALGARG